VQGIGWNLAAMSKEDEEAAGQFWKELERERGHLDDEYIGDKVERAAKRFQETLCEVLDAKATKMKICTRSQSLWNGELKERRRALGTQKRKGRRTGGEAPAKADLQRSIQQSKSRMWNDYLLNRKVVEGWRGAKFDNTRAGATVQALTDREGKQANTIAEKEKMLTGESFPPNEGDQYYELPPAGHAHECRTEQSVKRALFSQSVKKAPGPAKLSFGAIRLPWKWNRMRMVGLTKAAVRKKRRPTVWRRAGMVVIWIPRKEDYMKLNSYCTNSLLSCMGKLFEKLVAELLSDESETRALLSNGQFGIRKKRSAIGTGAIMVDRAH